jgi:cytochrome b561
MQIKKNQVIVAVLLVAAAGIKAYSGNAERVENGYATGLYPKIATVLRWLLGWLPFSIGDILYGLFVIWILWKLGKGIKTIINKKATWRGLLWRCCKIAVVCLLIYVVFNGFWGINYNRKGIAHQLGLKMENYTTQELKDINALLVGKVNRAKQTIIETNTPYHTSSELFNEVQKCYTIIDSAYPFLKYNNASIKSSLWGWLGNYVGFTGYYNPFTGEAQVNTTVPKFLQPFTACHEVAHQLGYAKENEANFVGYLAASASANQQFQYSVYLDIFLYSNRNLYNTDSSSATQFAKQLLPQVKNDIAAWRLFNQKHKNPIEPVIRWLYGKYLQSNEQPQGVLTYDAVTGFIIAYYKKFGKL